MCRQSDVLCCDPLAIALTAAVFGTAINHSLKPHLVRSTFDSRRAQAIEGHSGYGPLPDITGLNVTPHRG
jgi:hypothetical protein